ncbi:DUF1751 domain-containing protein [Candidatus Pacearchaeota archaeon CG10_big_fil_rev_8_21_14_0_10_31_9]|nr:MAG: DUF1751 domain-containing protein [Candidatus Pacearchaeota archaeon CG10_big_fil_rev_8_21_14_0_10_31_9]
MGMKYYAFWIAIILVATFALQSFVNGFTDALILNESSFSQPWRFITSMFLHGSLSHLLANLFALLLFGFILERTIGSERFLAVYLISGILANLIAVNFYSTSLGASGAIMGIIGALAILRPLMGVWVFGMILPMSIAAVIYIIIDAIGVFIPSNIGHIAHLSGIAFGIIFGTILRISKSKKEKKTHKIEVPEHLLRRWETLYMGAD